jgi:iron complex transport system substrate-binding protein
MLTDVRFSRRGLLAASLTLAALPRPAQAASIVDASGAKVAANQPQRIVSIGSSLTEIIMELGHAERIAAIDMASAGLSGMGTKPNVGYHRALSAEGVLAQGPDLICATSDAGPPEVVEAIRATGIAFALIPQVPTVEGIIAKIGLLGTLLNAQAAAADLGTRTRQTAEDLASRVSRFPGRRPRVLFVLSFTDNRLMAGGAETGAHTVIEMAGGENVAVGMKGYKPLSAEVLLQDPPDFIITMSGGGISADHAALLSFAPLQQSPAARAKAIRAFDGAYLLGFGPRTIVAAGELADFIHGAG